MEKYEIDPIIPIVAPIGSIDQLVIQRPFCESRQITIEEFHRSGLLECLGKTDVFGLGSIEQALEEGIEQFESALEIGLDVVPFGHGEFGVVELPELGGPKDASELVAATESTGQQSLHRLLWGGLQVPGVIVI